MRRFFWGVIISACIAAPLVVHIAAHQRQVDRERALQAQSERLAELSAVPAPSAEKRRPASNISPLTDAEHVELLQLRSEVGRLRRETNSVPQLKNDNQRLAAQPVAKTDSAPGLEVPRESWSFAGYATPEAALQSFIWGMSHGDRKVILQSLAGEMSDEFSKRLAGITDDKLAAEMSNGINKVSGYRITSREMLPNDEALLQFEPIEQSAGRNAIPIIKLKKIGGEWKLTNVPGNR